MKINKLSAKAGRDVQNLAGRDISIVKGNINMANNKIIGNHNIQTAGTVNINHNFNKKHLQFLQSLIERLYNEKESLQKENKELKAQLLKLQFEVKQQLQTARDFQDKLPRIAYKVLSCFLLKLCATALF